MGSRALSLRRWRQQWFVKVGLVTGLIVCLFAKPREGVGWRRGRWYEGEGGEVERVKECGMRPAKTEFQFGRDRDAGSKLTQWRPRDKTTGIGPVRWWKGEGAKCKGEVADNADG